ncbi:MAG TPA: DNA cytosine methyltransferase [Ilumatobacter sp.]|nr:DNA cytosine methyltransferase [Ilumatobacter sp.]
MILDLFAGPGGWSEGLRILGLHDIGIEWDAAACATRAAAGHLTIRADLTAYPVEPFRGRVTGLIASPPCTAFSVAGLGEGREHLPALVTAMYRGDWHALRDQCPLPVWAPLDVGRWIEGTEPGWIALEQVPPCLPLWCALAEWLRPRGYHTWTGILNAANYGVPQTRRRAFLLAHRHQPAAPPTPTHARRPQPTLFETRQPWVTMADALGWDGALRHTRGTGMTERHGPRPDRDTTEPAMTLGSKARSWELNRRQNAGSKPIRNVPDHEPAPTLTAAADAKAQWIWERPATTVVASFRPDVIGAPVHHGPGASRVGHPDSVRITPREALILQSFPPDYPVQGSRSKAFEQIGNAVPPLLATHVLAALTGRVLPVGLADDRRGWVA